MKKKLLFLLIVLFIPLRVYAIQSCIYDENGIEQCIELPDDVDSVEPDDLIENPKEDDEEENEAEPADTPIEEGEEEEPSIELTFDNTKLSYLKIVNYGIAFDPDTYEYTLKIPYNTKELYIIATSYEGVQISGVEEVEISKDQDEIVITTSYGGLEPTIYKIKIKRDYTIFVLLVICVLLIIGIVLVTIYAIINRTAYLDRKKRESIPVTLSPQEAIQVSGAAPQQIKVVKSVIPTSKAQPTVVKKQVIVNTSSGQPFNSIINSQGQSAPSVLNLNEVQNVSNNQNNIQ